MQTRLVAMEEGKEPPAMPTRASQPKLMPLKLVLFLLLFFGLGIALTIVSMFMTRHYEFDNNVILITSSRIHPCFQQPISFQSWIKPPSIVRHYMNDSQLFWRASFGPQIKSFPFNRIPRIAFMFLTRGPLPMALLWEKYFKGHEKRYSIYVHAMPTYVEDYSPSSVFIRGRFQVSLIYSDRRNSCRFRGSVATESPKQVEETMMDMPKEIFLKDYKSPDYYFDTALFLHWS